MLHHVFVVKVIGQGVHGVVFFKIPKKSILSKYMN